MKDTREANGRERARRRLRVVAIVVLAVLTLVFAALGMKDVTPANITAAVAYLQEGSLLTLACFTLGCALSMPLLLPGSMLQLIAGAVWGMGRGLAVSFPGTCCGQLLTFLLGRYLLKDSLAVWLVRRFPSWPTVEKALFIQGGAKMITLLRLAPVMPDSITSYGLSLTRVSTLTFTACTTLAGLPYALLYTYLGSTSSNIAQTIAGGGDSGSSDNPGVTLLLAVVSCVAVALMAVYVGVTLRRALAEAAAVQQQEAGLGDAGGDVEQPGGGTGERAPLLLASESSGVKPL